jgi:hypothetical protein
VEFDGGEGGADWGEVAHRGATGASDDCGDRARDSDDSVHDMLRGLVEAREEREGIYRGARLAEGARV